MRKLRHTLIESVYQMSGVRLCQRNDLPRNTGRWCWFW